MELDQHYLMAKVKNSSQILEAISNLKLQIRKNDTKQKGVHTIHFINEPIMLLPKEKEEEPKEEKKTKWESFAEKRGIEKVKKSFFVIDDETGKKSHRYGSLSKKNLELRQGIYEGDMTYSKMRREKQKRINKNKESMMQNKEKAKKVDIK